MASGILVGIKEEVTCPICLELLTKPLSLDCGHNFCQACITANKDSRIDQGAERRCPVCQIPYKPGNLKPNRPMANIVERLREVKLRPEEEQKRDLCVRHEEKLLLFCKEDGKVICWLCERSQEHRDHQTFLVEEVVQEYQEKLQAALERMRKEQQEVEMLEANVREETTSWKNQIESETQRIQAGFKQLRGILDDEEQKELLKLKNETGDVLHNLAEAENELVEQRQLVSSVISDLEHRLQGSALEMLQDVNGILQRSETWTLKEPKMVSRKTKCAFRVPDLSGMLQVFKELTEAQCYWVNVTLRPTSSSNIVISADQRRVRIMQPVTSGDTGSYDFSVFDAVGLQSFSSGKFYWEVDVSKKIAWILGVCNHKFYHARRLFYQLKLRKENRLKVYSKFRPRAGCWVIGLQDEFAYNAFEDSSTSGYHVLTLSVPVPPHRVGVFLDYEGGSVSFFNVTNHGSLIYKFSKCCFSQAVCPYFNPWNCPRPIILCPPSS
ncbi:E3 ubiquitin-protein ligase TRIM22-like isoform X1 [Equus przewalskii]|uniref:E3 ubiquitin-protein ligase TRIM22-like isoform X1 n=1 Tax=Equus przewalskii TaxID=9798 RepID=A0ABM4PT43_EQUPR